MCSACLCVNAQGLNIRWKCNILHTHKTKLRYLPFLFLRVLMANEMSSVVIVKYIEKQEKVFKVDEIIKKDIKPFHKFKKVTLCDL